MNSSGVRTFKNSFVNSAVLFCSILSLQTTSFANGAGVASLERPVSEEVSCNKEGTCTYIVKNVASRIPILIRDSLNEAFGDSFVIFSEGNIRPQHRGSNLVVFRFKEQRDKERFVTALVNNDVLEDQSILVPQVKFTFKVYALDTEAYNNLELGLTAFSNSASPLETAAPKIDLTSSVSAAGILKSGLQLNIGNLTSALFGLKLDLSRLGSWSMNSIDYDTVVTNGEPISAFTNTPTFSKTLSNHVSLEKADIGLNVSGRVFLDKSGRGLRIENFYVRYAAPTPDENSIMNETTVSRPSLRIQTGRPYVLGMKTVLLDSNSKGSNFIFAGKSSKNKISSTLFIVITANLVRDESTEQIFADSEAQTLKTATNPRITDQELSGSTKTLMESLSSATGFVVPINQAIGSVLFGQVAGIQVKAESVDRLNANRIITVIEKNQVSQQTKKSYIRMLDLITKGYNFKTLSFPDLQIPCQKQRDKCQSMKIELELSEMDSEQSVRLLATYLPEQRIVKLVPNTVPVAKPSGISRLFSGPQQD